MKFLSYLVTGTCIAAFTLLVPVSAFAQGAKSKGSPSPSASPKESGATASSASTTAEKPARAIPLRGTATSVDKSAKTFTIAGKTSSRVFKATDSTTITKAGAEAKFSELADNDYVTGSYWKRDDGTLELKSLKIGGKGDEASVQEEEQEGRRCCGRRKRRGIEARSAGSVPEGKLRLRRSDPPQAFSLFHTDVEVVRHGQKCGAAASGARWSAERRWICR